MQAHFPTYSMQYMAMHIWQLLSFPFVNSKWVSVVLQSGFCCAIHGLLHCTGAPSSTGSVKTLKIMKHFIISFWMKIVFFPLQQSIYQKSTLPHSLFNCHKLYLCKCAHEKVELTCVSCSICWVTSFYLDSRSLP